MDSASAGLSSLSVPPEPAEKLSYLKTSSAGSLNPIWRKEQKNVTRIKLKKASEPCQHSTWALDLVSTVSDRNVRVDVFDFVGQFFMLPPKRPNYVDELQSSWKFHKFLFGSWNCSVLSQII